MKILCDENVPNKYAREIANLNSVTVTTVETELGAGVNDYVVRDYAEQNDSVVLTNDKGFLQTKHADNHGLLYIFQNNNPAAGDVATAIDKIESAYQDPGDIDEVVPNGWV